MLGKIIDALTGRRTLLDEASQEAVMMLMNGRRMFDLVMRAIKDEAGQHIRQRILTMDKEVNQEQRDVRRKVFEHLTISRGQDLQRGLELTIAVIDLERIGDYTKNISELVEMMPGRIDFGEHEALYEELLGFTHQLFDHCTLAFSKQDVDSARKVIEIYQRVSAICDGTLANLVAEAQERESLPKNQVALVLLLRYLKRVAAHLKNVASTVINPYDRIGFRA